MEQNMVNVGGFVCVGQALAYKGKDRSWNQQVG